MIPLPDGDCVPDSARDRRITPNPQVQLKRGDDQEPREWAQRLQRQLDYRFAEIDQVTDRRLVSRTENPSATAARVLVAPPAAQDARRGRRWSRTTTPSGRL